VWNTEAWFASSQTSFVHGPVEAAGPIRSKAAARQVCEALYVAVDCAG
jgi:hypothetical protein